MPINIPRGTTDEGLENILAVMRDYEADHPRAQIDLYRHSPVSVRLRITNPEFAGHGKPDRSDQVWRYLERMPEELQSDIGTVLLLTPDETKSSFANFEFEDPVPSPV
jgi:hypothetical protein